ncbi:MAG: hypothetical protein JW927_12050 [Deltaproteobacteria bacterium]|nr:hypothetical protein [Deltaproteobacteria bacterium]
MKKTRLLNTLFLLSAFFLLFSSCQDTEITTSDTNVACYAATYGEGIYKSDNGGKSWYPMKMNQEDIHLYFKRLFLDPDNDLLYVATTGAGLFSIDLKNESIHRIEQYKGKNVRSVAFVKNMDDGPATLAGVFDEGVSMVGADEKRYLNTGLTYRDVNTIITSEKNIFAGTVKDIFRWDNQKKVWESASVGIKNKNIISMAVTPKGDMIFAGAGGYLDEKGFFDSTSCLYMSRDNGKTWEAWDDGMPGDTLVYSIAINMKRPERIYAGTSDGVYMSYNGGDDWDKTDDGLPNDFRVFDIKIKNLDDENDLVYVAGSKGIFMAFDTDDPDWVNRGYGLPKTNITGIEVRGKIIY